jgi:hypothetical protein
MRHKKKDCRSVQALCFEYFKRGSEQFKDYHGKPFQQIKTMPPKGALAESWKNLP